MSDNLNKINLWMPVIKNSKTGEYLAVLSDTSIDRDDEGMSKELIDSWATYTSVKALANHENKMQSWVGGWRNLKSKEKNGNYALFAEPWFFTKDANPLAEQIKKQVDEALEHGECAGISVGAIVHDSEMRKINGTNKRIFTKGELLEATWVPIQSNRNASFGHVAKGFDLDKIFDNKNMEGNKVENFTQKDIDSAVSKKVDEMKVEFSKQLESKVAEIEKMKVDIDKSVSEIAKAKEELEVEKTKSIDAAKKVSEMESDLKKTKDEALEKQKFADQGAQKGSNSEDSEKAMKEGKLPIMRG
jgi:hypothetical protein